MFIGHFAIGFASKRWAPGVSLAVLLAAPLLSDLMFPVLVVAGVEHAHIVRGDTPFLALSLDEIGWSHSLLTNAVWAAIMGGLVWRWTKDRSAALVVVIGVLSHWVLDWVTHRPDMPLYPGGAGYGLTLWRSVPGTMAVEIVMFSLSVMTYARMTRARDRIGSAALWALVALLGAAYLGNAFGPPPPELAPVLWIGIVANIVILAWVFWIDRHRELRVA